ncbi:MAG: pyruvate/ketoisovalerate oxidoreductase, 2-oxoglutarate ferredoxin oxidoreductase subunit gamma [Candidatus Berkelbacteria bacterium]|nr:pyruvate/ketoisovalerate oxidoreductase, 2-oxoglutarate ferredoxin oxidoreductase subunit gamma [Candidatus Berkelbacteria bacterium]
MLSEAKSAPSGMKILISGEGGQGVQIISEVIAKTAHKIGKNTSYMPQFGVEQRGGASVAFLQIADKKIIYPKFSKANIVLVMSNRSIDAVKQYLNQETLFIFDSTNIDNEHLNQIRNEVTKVLNINAREWALKNLSTKVTNMIFLGALLQYLPDIKVEDIKNVLSDKLINSKNAELIDMDFRAIDYGYNIAREENNNLNGQETKEIENISQDDNKTWQRYPKFCKSCELCIVRCPVKALSFSNELNYLGTQLPQIDINKCTACGLCQLICPDGAIKVTKKN